MAGCGSTGGACTASLARVGVQNFALADNGEYELNNLNRQHAEIRDLGRNKAEFHAERIRGINPACKIEVHTTGMTPANTPELVAWADIIMDAVDVTTESGIAAKLELHRVAHGSRKPVLTALDMGYCQYGKSFDYRKTLTPLMGGRFEAIKAAKHPMKALFTLVPLWAVPGHCLQLIDDLLTGKAESASQLGCTSDLLASIIVPAIVRFVETGDVVRGWRINLAPIAGRRLHRWARLLPELALRVQIHDRLRRTP